METILNNLRAVLCDPEGKCCISGSDADRAIVDEALAAIAAHEQARVVGEPVAWAATSEDGKVEALGFNQSRRFDTPLVFASPPAPQEAQADSTPLLPVARIRSWTKHGEGHGDLVDWLEGSENLPDGEYDLYLGPQSEQKPVASIYISPNGEREFDDWKHDLPIGRNELFAAPVAQPATDTEQINRGCRYTTDLMQPATTKQAEAPSGPLCANCGKAGAAIHEGDAEGDVWCSSECYDQHGELGCPHETHNGFRHPVESRRLIECENVLRSLASWLSAGGYNAPTVDPKAFEEKIRWGVDEAIKDAARLATQPTASNAALCPTCGANTASDNPNQWCACPKPTASNAGEREAKSATTTLDNTFWELVHQCTIQTGNEPSKHACTALEEYVGDLIHAQRLATTAEAKASIDRLSDILRRTVNAIRGEPPENTAWGWKDLPERAALASKSVAPPATAQPEQCKGDLGECAHNGACMYACGAVAPPAREAFDYDPLETAIDSYIEDYEMIGETECGQDACHTPNDNERALIKDAIMGLLADSEWDRLWGEHIDSLVAQRSATPPAQAVQDSAVLAYLDDLSDDAAAHIYPSDLEKCSNSECVVEVCSVRAGNGLERTVPLFSRGQVIEALNSARTRGNGVEPS